MKVLHTSPSHYPPLPPHTLLGGTLAMQSALVHTQKLTAARLRRVQLWGGAVRESTCSRKWKPNKNAIETKTVYFIGCAASLATQQSTPTSILNRGEEHHFIPPPPPQRSKQRQTKALRNYVNGVVVLLVYLPPLSPAISTFQTDRDSATDSDWQSERESTPESIPPYRTMKVDAFVAYQNQNWIQKSHQKSIREHTATGSARATWSGDGMEKEVDVDTSELWLWL